MSNAQYEIHVEGHLGPQWAAWFDGLTISTGADGTTVLRGPIVDQAALHGLLQTLRDIGIPLISLTPIHPNPKEADMANPTTTTTPMDATRKAALIAGLFYVGTFVFSIPALALYDGVLNDANFVLGSGSDQGVLWGGLIEILTGLTGIGTAVALYPVIKRYGPSRAVGFVGSRVLEASMIFAGVLAVLSVFTLRQDLAGAAGTDTDALTTTAHALVAFKDWTFLLGPGIMPAVSALCLATIMYQSRLVPRIIPILGLIGAPLLLISSTGTLFGAWDQVSANAFVFALPIAAWEFSLGIYMIVKGFRRPASADDGVETATTMAPLDFAVA